jgi:hypothetical protein
MAMQRWSLFVAAALCAAALLLQSAVAVADKNCDKAPDYSLWCNSADSVSVLIVGKVVSDDSGNLMATGINVPLVSPPPGLTDIVFDKSGRQVYLVWVREGIASFKAPEPMTLTGNVGLALRDEKSGATVWAELWFLGSRTGGSTKTMSAEAEKNFGSDTSLSPFGRSYEVYLVFPGWTSTGMSWTNRDVDSIVVSLVLDKTSSPHR